MSARTFVRSFPVFLLLFTFASTFRNYPLPTHPIVFYEMEWKHVLLVLAASVVAVVEATPWWGHRKCGGGWGAPSCTTLTPLAPATTDIATYTDIASYAPPATATETSMSSSIVPLTATATSATMTTSTMTTTTPTMVVSSSTSTTTPTMTTTTTMVPATGSTLAVASASSGYSYGGSGGGSGAAAVANASGISIQLAGVTLTPEPTPTSTSTSTMAKATPAVTFGPYQAVAASTSGSSGHSQFLLSSHGIAAAGSIWAVALLLQ